MPSDRGLKKFFLSRWFLATSAVVLLFVAFAYARAYYQDYQVRQEIARLHDKVKHLETKKLEALEILKYVQSTAFVEEKGREELNLVKPGEHLSIIASSASPRILSGQRENTVVEWSHLSNYKKWWRYFFGESN